MVPVSLLALTTPVILLMLAVGIGAVCAYQAADARAKGRRSRLRGIVAGVAVFGVLFVLTASMPYLLRVAIPAAGLVVTTAAVDRWAYPRAPK